MLYVVVCCDDSRVVEKRSFSVFADACQYYDYLLNHHSFSVSIYAVRNITPRPCSVEEMDFLV